MTYDEILVSKLRGINPRVFHLEVFQKNPSTDRYPCIVYRLVDDQPEEELAENSGLATAVYEITLIARDSATLRTWAEQIKSVFTSSDFIDGVYCDTDGEITWIYVFNDAEQNEFAIEQQEKGYKTTSLQVAMDHWVQSVTTTSTTTTPA